ncbi:MULTISPECIES: hypothetical protein [Gordonia]|uniref:Uncharacterized protein n=1 Tax=Gordonia amicalis TaxID=89053 RepID=A0AAE4U9R1_9ACTN|nr:MULTISPECIES: hypothetical protein [Gordonia]MCZ4654010.1 hypothetical protein [Gordonia amicalis]MDJ0453824.1 hypothetical protein [Gordonia amicalis]MDV6307630.1 hypothetical protein [Gordonia amicalis]MDV6312588.1 hypothetical protein [Gordonia amicalis]MDV7076969.1 hypothetical protein [Gordonia amicalis]
MRFLMPMQRYLREAPSILKQGLSAWSVRHMVVAVIAGAVIGVVIALATALIPNPVFVRSIGPEWWNAPVLVLSAVLGGLLVASYVRSPGTATDADRPGRLGMAGGFLTWFAVGCPVCNKLVVLTLGSSGAMTWFAPMQPVMAVAAVGLSAVALTERLRAQQKGCRIRFDAPGSDPVAAVPR